MCCHSISAINHALINQWSCAKLDQVNLKDKVSPCTNSICHIKKGLVYLKANDQNDHYIPKYSDQKCI